MDVTSLRIVATIVSFLTFIGIVVWTLSKRNKKSFNEAAQYPFIQEDAPYITNSSEEAK